MDLARKVLTQIEEENIRIRPRWFWKLEKLNAWFWAVVLEGGAALCFGLFLLFALGKGNLSGGLFLAGIFALLFFWGFRLFFQAGFRHFYKLGFTALFLSLFVVNGALGFAFWGSGQAQNLENQIRETPVYQKIEPAVEKAFSIKEEKQTNWENSTGFSDNNQEDSEKDEAKEHPENDSANDEADSDEGRKSNRSETEEEKRTGKEREGDEAAEEQKKPEVKGIQAENKSGADERENQAKNEEDSKNDQEPDDEAESDPNNQEDHD